MRLRASACAVIHALIGASCGRGSDASVAGFPRAEAAAYCHFAYACCSPADRRLFPNFSQVGTYNPLIGNRCFDELATAYGFKDESGCLARLEAPFQNLQLRIQASVKEGRMTYLPSGAQACLDALAAATARCSPATFRAAFFPDPNRAASKAVCDEGSWTHGAVAGKGACTMAQDCSAAGAGCFPAPPDAGVFLVAEGICIDPPTQGQACGNGAACAPGNSCCDQNVCQGYVPRGQACGSSYWCSAQPCSL